MKITAEITGIKYSPKLIPELKKFNFDDFDINELPSYCLVEYEDFSFGLSKWLSPKRTRSYPYERIYNTLGSSKRITVIPIIKDEGKNGDRDFIQWDTVSLMSLLDVYVIFAYYYSAEKHSTKPNKITNQVLDNSLVKKKIEELKNYHSSALHWNLSEIEKSFPDLIRKVKSSYGKIGKRLNVKFHSEEGIDKFAEQFINGVKSFMQTSRTKAREAQAREVLTEQPKEALARSTKAIITIENYLGGKYYFTTDEIKIQGNSVFLIEAKHSKTSLLPSKSDIKDGLLKMILYSNLENVKVNEKPFSVIPVLKLTSSKLQSHITSEENERKLETFFIKNRFDEKNKSLVKDLLEEAQENNFQIVIEHAETKK